MLHFFSPKMIIIHWILRYMMIYFPFWCFICHIFKAAICSWEIWWGPLPEWVYRKKRCLQESSIYWVVKTINYEDSIFWDDLNHIIPTMAHVICGNCWLKTSQKHSLQLRCFIKTMKFVLMFFTSWFLLSHDFPRKNHIKSYGFQLKLHKLHGISGGCFESIDFLHKPGGFLKLGITL